MSIPTDAEIVAAYQAAPFKATMDELCKACHSDSRPIRVLCEAGLIGHKVVRPETLPKMCNYVPDNYGGRYHDRHKWSEEELHRARKLRKQGYTYREIGEMIGRRASQVDHALTYKRKGKAK